MRGIAVALFLALAGCGGAEPATIDDGIAWGTVLSTEQLPDGDLPDPRSAYDSLLVPGVAWQVVVQLDGGSAVILTHRTERRYARGERVRILFEDNGVLLL